MKILKTLGAHSSFLPSFSLSFSFCQQHIDWTKRQCPLIAEKQANAQYYKPKEFKWPMSLAEPVTNSNTLMLVQLHTFFSRLRPFIKNPAGRYLDYMCPNYIFFFLCSNDATVQRPRKPKHKFNPEPSIRPFWNWENWSLPACKCYPSCPQTTVTKFSLGFH